MNLEAESIKWCTQKYFSYVPIEATSLQYIYDVCCKDIIKEPNTAMEMLYIVNYYLRKTDYEKMFKYLHMAAENKNVVAM